MSRTMYITGMQLQAHTLTAHNDAAASTNKIHDDTVARQYGFRGGLVPGISVYAYMTYPLVHNFGAAWLTQGTARVQLAKPIYEGDQVTVTGTVNAVAESGMHFDLASMNSEGVACGIGTATLPTASNPSPDLAEIPLAQPQEDGAVELRIAPDVVVDARMERLAVLVVPSLPGLVLVVDEHGLAVPVVLLARQVAAPFQQQDSLAGRGQLVSKRATASAGADDDDVVV